MSQKPHHHLPAGCHDADTAAELLSISKRELLRRMRELGWLITAPGTDNHNLPRRELLQRGLLCTQERGFALKGKLEITKTYRVMLLTQRGYEELKKIMQSNQQPSQAEPETPSAKPKSPPQTKAHAVPELTTKPMTAAQRAAADIERQKAIQQLKQWGIMAR